MTPDHASSPLHRPSLYRSSLHRSPLHRMPAAAGPDRSSPPGAPRRTRAALVGAVLALTAVSALGLVGPAPAGAAPGSGTGPEGQTLTVSQVDDLDPAGTLVTVTGAGFDAEAGFDTETMGLYLSVCLDTGPGAAPSPCLGGVDQSGETATSRWITNNPVGEAEVVPIAPDGSFETTLLATGVDAAAGIDCRTPPTGTSCKVVTRVDHRGSGNRSQDVKVAVTFSGRTAAQSFVTAALTDFLHTEPSDQQVSAGVAQLQAQGKPRYLRTLSTSDAWLEAVVQKLYHDTLGRGGDPAGVAFWVGQLRSGRRTVAGVAAELYASSEYFNGLGGGTVGTWIDDLYEKVLLRSSDSAGRTYWVGQVAARGRGNVALSFYQSPESARTRVQGLYQALLGRNAGSADLTYWAPEVVARGDLTLAVVLADSSEYQSRAVTRFP